MRKVFAVAVLALIAGFVAVCKQKDPATTTDKKPAAAATGEPYEVTVTPPREDGKVGAPVAATIKLVPRRGYKVNLEYPTKLTVKAPASATPATQVLVRKDAVRFDAAEAIFAPRTAFASAGNHRVSATFKFSVCTDKVCEMKTEKLFWMAAVK